MPDKLGFGALGFAAGLGFLGLHVLGTRAEQPGPYEGPVRNETTSAVQTPETTVEDWPLLSRVAARALIAKYGEPDLFDDARLVWEQNDPWEETVVYREAPLNSLKDNGKNVVKQSIIYDVDVPDKKIEALRRFDPRVRFDPETGMLSSSAESERLNSLALNLADEIVRDQRTAAAARDFYARTRDLAAAGKNSPYMDGFLFPLNQDLP